MKTKIIFAFIVMIGVAVVVSYQGADRKVTNQVSASFPPAQFSVVCENFRADFDPCGDMSCNGPGWLEVTGQYSNGPGLKAFQDMSVSCQYSDCPSETVPTAYDNPYCCDQDGDTFPRSGCGIGNDCNDTPNSGYNINPDATETCNNIDDNCNGQIDEGFDTDGDGWTTCAGDCDNTIYPGAPLTNCSSWTDSDCDGIANDLECVHSPIVLDIAGNGFNLTNAANGVAFDLNSDGVREQLSWTSANSDDAWLVLDRDNNGQVDNGQELFGNFTPQPLSSNPNGFIALAEYDKTANGGNADGIIDHRDSIFPSLHLWQDKNHNGISETSELKTLSALNIKTIELDYKESKRKDEHGNQFKYRAKVWDGKKTKVGRWAWDVFLLKTP